MPKTLEKTRKQIAKKRRGVIGALHQGSRDSRRLHRAQVRDESLEKIAAARRKTEQPLSMYPLIHAGGFGRKPHTDKTFSFLTARPRASVNRAAFFQEIANETDVEFLTPDKVQSHIST